MRKGEAGAAMKQERPARQGRHVGLARALSKLGYCSRSQAALLIEEGRVKLNDTTRRNPETPVLLGSDRIEVEGKVVGGAAKIYLMMNKPRGVVTTASDEQGRTTVYDLVPADTPWMGPAGRLDKASEGLLLLSNDSEWAARIISPESHIEKTYHVQIDGEPGERVLGAFKEGIRTKEGELLRARRAEVLRQGERNTWLLITLDEGKNRQIRRMLEHFGIGVLRLIRVSIGPLELGKLAKGACRRLSEGEKRAIDGLISQRACEARKEKPATHFSKFRSRG